MPDPQYTTRDFYLASFVLSEGAVLVGVKRLGPKKVEFRFLAGPELHTLLRLYWRNEPVLLTPSQLFNSHRELKSLGRARP